jgi:hypothetical protein
LIRALANDAIFSQAGEILTDTSTLLFPLMNDGIEWMSAELDNSGVDTFTKEIILASVTAVPIVDPGLQVNISDTGYFDSSVNRAAPQFPTDGVNPLFIWERKTGSTEQWVPMEQILMGLPSVVQSSRLKLWEWRQDGLYMPGATQSNDLRVRYSSSHPQLVSPTDTLQVRNAIGPVAYKTVASYLISKNPEAAQLAMAEARDRLALITNRSARQKQTSPAIRQSYGNPSSARRDFMPPRNA